MPWFTDAGVLYYRKDLLEKHGKEPPTTWQELTETATEIQDAERAEGNDRMWGFVFQAQGLRGPDLQRARVDRQLRRRHDRRPKTARSRSTTTRPSRR